MQSLHVSSAFARPFCSSRVNQKRLSAVKASLVAYIHVPKSLFNLSHHLIQTLFLCLIAFTFMSHAVWQLCWNMRRMKATQTGHDINCHIYTLFPVHSCFISRFFDLIKFRKLLLLLNILISPNYAPSSFKEMFQLLYLPLENGLQLEPTHMILRSLFLELTLVEKHFFTVLRFFLTL